MDTQIYRIFETRSCIKIRIEDFAKGSILFIYPNSDNLVKVNTIGLDYDKTMYSYIQDIFIHKDHRNKGLGTKMIKHFIELSKEKGFKEIYLHAYHDETKLEDLVKIYSNFGFEVIREEPLSCEMLLKI